MDGVSGQTSAAGVAVFINVSGKLGTTTSSRRFKEDIVDIAQESELGASTNLNFGKPASVTRPDPGNLNPYVDHEYTPNLAAGNPNLKSQFTQAYEIGYGFEGHSLSVTVRFGPHSRRSAVHP